MAIRATNTAYKATPSMTVGPLWGKDVIAYDRDNNYPDRIYQNIIQSGTAWSASEKFARFIKGDGFEDATFNKARINYKRETVMQVLRKAAKDYAIFNGFALWISYNALLEIDAVYNVPFSHVRLGYPDSKRHSSKIAIFDNWVMDNHLPHKMTSPLFVDTYNPDSEAVNAQIEQAGGIKNYAGQVLFFRGDFDLYPLAWLDSVIDAVAVDREIPAFQKQAIETNFMASHYISLPFEFNTDDQRARFQDSINNFQGSRNAGKIMYIENASPEYSVQFEKVEQQDWDKKFQVTEQAVRDRIYRALGQSPVLHGVATAGELGSAKQVEEAFLVYNQHTKDDRQAFSMVFQDVFSRFAVPVNPSGNYEIIPLEFNAPE